AHELGVAGKWGVLEGYRTCLAWVAKGDGPGSSCMNLGQLGARQVYVGARGIAPDAHGLTGLRRTDHHATGRKGVSKLTHGVPANVGHKEVAAAVERQALWNIQSCERGRGGGTARSKLAHRVLQYVAHEEVAAAVERQTAWPIQPGERGRRGGAARGEFAHRIWSYPPFP